MDTFVLDAWAVMALLQREEPAAGVVHEKLSDAAASPPTVSLHMSQINVGEVFYITAKARGAAAAQTVLTHLQAAPLAFEEATSARMMAAARLKSLHPLSYADAFAAALALELGATILTGDAAFTPLETREGLVVEWLTRTL